MEQFFRKINTQLEATEHLNNQDKKSVSPISSPEDDDADMELLQADESFSQLLSHTSLLHNQSVTLLRKMEQVFGHSFLGAFTAEPQPRPVSVNQGGSGAGLFRVVGLDHILIPGGNKLNEFSSTVADVFEEQQEAEESFEPTSRGIRAAHLLSLSSALSKKKQ